MLRPKKRPNQIRRQQNRPLDPTMIAHGKLTAQSGVFWAFAWLCSYASFVAQSKCHFQRVIKTSILSSNQAFFILFF
jgi:hypothetical protein